MATYLREWREASGLTLEQLGDRLGKHFTTVQKWEAGDNKVKTEDLEKLAAIFGVHPAALFYHPNDRAMAQRLDSASKILGRMTPAQAATWLATGDAIAPDKTG